MLGASRRDTLNDNGRRLQAFSAENQLALVNTFFSAPSVESHTLAKVQILEKIVTAWIISSRGKDRRRVQNVTMRRPPVPKPESDHTLAAADIRLLGRFALTTVRETKGRWVIYLQRLMASPQLRGVVIERFTPLPPGTDVDGMATAFTEAMLSTATNIIAPRARRCQGPRRWRSSAERVVF